MPPSRRLLPHQIPPEQEDEQAGRWCLRVLWSGVPESHRGPLFLFRQGRCSQKVKLLAANHGCLTERHESRPCLCGCPMRCAAPSNRPRAVSDSKLNPGSPENRCPVPLPLAVSHCTSHLDSADICIRIPDTGCLHSGCNSSTPRRTIED